MVLQGKKIYLRDYIFSDINDHINWNTMETEWLKWDAPWEENDFDAAKYIDFMTQKLLTPKTDDDIRWSFQIVEKNSDIHIGWVSSYDIDDNFEYSQNGSHLAVGIDIPPKEYRGCGYGKEALLLFIDYFKQKGYRELFTQTWFGNLRMIALAKSLGFVEVDRKKDKRLVDGIYYDALTFMLKV
ncbi:MAG TPA: GNAT family protein [Clostridia bacterium]